MPSFQNRLKASEDVFLIQHEANSRFETSMRDLALNITALDDAAKKRLEKLRIEFIDRWTKETESANHRFGLHSSENSRNQHALQLLSKSNRELERTIENSSKQISLMESEFDMKPLEVP